jgi:hypothetical protein
MPTYEQLKESRRVHQGIFGTTENFPEIPSANEQEHSNIIIPDKDYFEDAQNLLQQFLEEDFDQDIKEYMIEKKYNLNERRFFIHNLQNAFSLHTGKALMALMKE